MHCFLNIYSVIVAIDIQCVHNDRNKFQVR